MKALLRIADIGLNILIGTFLFCVCSCTRYAVLEGIVLPADSPATDVDRFAVIAETYIALKDKPGVDGIIINHARRNEVYEIKGTQFILQDGKSELWVHLSDGWIERSCVQLYSSRARAQTAAARLK